MNPHCVGTHTLLAISLVPVHPSIHRPVHPSIQPFIHPTNSHQSNHLSHHPSIQPFIHMYTHPFSHLYIQVLKPQNLPPPPVPPFLPTDLQHAGARRAEVSVIMPLVYTTQRLIKLAFWGFLHIPVSSLALNVYCTFASPVHKSGLVL